MTIIFTKQMFLQGIQDAMMPAHPLMTAASTQLPTGPLQLPGNFAKLPAGVPRGMPGGPPNAATTRMN